METWLAMFSKAQINTGKHICTDRQIVNPSRKCSESRTCLAHTRQSGRVMPGRQHAKRLIQGHSDLSSLLVASAHSDCTGRFSLPFLPYLPPFSSLSPSHSSANHFLIYLHLLSPLLSFILASSVRAYACV